MRASLGEVIVTPYGGVEEIGGNKILVQNKKTKNSFFLDFGKSFSVARKYYEFPFSLPSSIKELIEIGAVPNIPEIYTKNTNSLEGDPKTNVKAVFVSHAHLDHIGHIPLLNRNIEIYMGECAKKIVEGLQTLVIRKTFENNWENIKIETFVTGEEIDLDNGDITVKPVHVDHSIPGAYGYIIYIEGKTISYTGDFRLHGATSNLTRDFLRKLEGEEIDVLITEATRIDMSDYMSEKHVKLLASNVIERSKNMVILDFSKTDYDRFRTFYEIAKELNRNLVLQPKIAKALESISKCTHLRNKVRLTENILILDEGKKRLSKGEKEVISKNQDKLITIEEIRKDPEAYMLVYMVYSGQDIKKINPPKGSIYILSSSEPVDEEREITFERVLNWLEKYGVAIYHIHASGHATPLDLRDTVETTQPQFVIPIHTLRPNLVKNFIDGERKWLLPSAGSPIKI